MKLWFKAGAGGYLMPMTMSGWLVAAWGAGLNADPGAGPVPPVVAAPAKTGNPVAPDAEAVVVGGFRRSFKPEKPAAGWHYFWCPAEDIGNGQRYQPLFWNKAADAYVASPSGAGGGLTLGLLSGGAVRDAFVIAACAMPALGEGTVWLTDGNIMKPIGGENETIELRAYVNGVLKYSDRIATADTPMLFQQELGPLKQGDMVSVAVRATSGKAENLFHLDFNLKQFPPGTEPEELLNLLKPPADMPEVRRLPGGGPSPAFLQAHENFMRQAAAVKPEVIFIGDALTAGWLDTGKAIWNKHISVYKPLNLGLNGDRIENVLWRLTNGELDRIAPKVIVLMIGTNNLYMYSADEICAGIAAVLSELTDRLPDSKILLLGITPRAKSPAAKVRAKIRQINALLAQMADGEDIRFLDFGAELLEPDGSISEEIMPDFLRLSESGYNIWFDEMSPILLEMLGMGQ